MASPMTVRETLEDNMPVTQPMCSIHLRTTTCEPTNGLSKVCIRAERGVPGQTIYGQTVYGQRVYGQTVEGHTVYGTNNIQGQTIEGTKSIQDKRYKGQMVYWDISLKNGIHFLFIQL